MAQIGTLDFTGFIEKEAKGDGFRAYGSHAYAYSSDRTTRLAFERMKPVELAVMAAVRLFKNVGKSELLGHAVKVGPRQFPRVHRIAGECAKTLGIAQPTVFIVNNPIMNAATYGTNDDSFILVHSGLVDNFSDEELKNVIGHECGHIHNSHVVYLTAMFYLTHMASMFVGWLVRPATMALMSWLRRAEVTCDRAGLLCCKDLDAATRTFTKLAIGSPKLHAELDVEAFLDQHREAQEGAGRYAEMNASHPWLPKRVLAIRTFADSELYKRHTGRADKGLTMEEVDKRVHDVIRVM